MIRKLVNGWTAEKVLEQVKKYNNGTRAVFFERSCAYQASDGNRCFIGAFIPDGHPALEQSADVLEILAEYKDLASLMPFDETDDLKDFQISHDMANVEFEGNTHAALVDFLQDCE